MTFAELALKSTNDLKNAGIEDAGFDAKELIIQTANLHRNTWMLQRKEEADKETISLVEKLVKRRIQGEPLQYILGEWEFYGRTFSVGEGVLIPRADTEVLIDVLKEKSDKDQPLFVADLCSGSGIIGLTIANEFPQSTVWLLEKSPLAMEYLHQNRLKDKNIAHRTHELLIDVLDESKINKQFSPNSLDIIVSNPPYLDQNDMKCLQREVQKEPSMALFGGEDGLLFYREITRLWRPFLSTKGLLYYEVGIHQADTVKEILLQEGFEDLCVFEDYQGVPRVVGGKKTCNFNEDTV